MWIVLISIAIVLFFSYIILKGMQSTITVLNVYENDRIEYAKYLEKSEEYVFGVVDDNSRREIVVKEKNIELYYNCDNAKVVVIEMENENYNRAIIYNKKGD